MKILKTLTLRGPNYWSIRHEKLIVLRLDLGEADQSTRQIPGLDEALLATLPQIDATTLADGVLADGVLGDGVLGEGGLNEGENFLAAVQAGIPMARVVSQVALVLQSLVGFKVTFGRSRSTLSPGVHQVIFEYEDEQAGRYAGRAAARLCQSLVETGAYPLPELEKDLEDLNDFRAKASLGPSTETIVSRAEERGIPWFPLSARAMIQLGYGIHQKRIQATMTSSTGILGVELACDKEGTKQILRDAGIPVPRGVVIHYLTDLVEAIADVGGFPIVIKPLDGNHGRGITININTMELAEEAYDAAKAVSKGGVILERYYAGRDHRILVVNGEVAAVAERVPAHVIGDGHSTIEALIEIVNQDPRRGVGHDNVLTKITLDRTSWELLERQGYTLQTVLDAGEICYLKATANLSTGGIAIDRTDQIHPENIWLAQRVAKTIGLDIAGIDVVTADISRPLREVNGVIVEVNAAPGFRMHACPSEGKPRDVGGAVLDMLFPPGTPSRIPIITITGTNGKTTTTRLTAHLFRQTGKVVGYTTTDGVYLGDYLVEKGDNTGPQSAQMILQDPTVEVAVLETARGGILRSGVAFRESDVAIALNVAADHLGIGDIETIEELADVKSVVVETASINGYAILNADDPLVREMASRVKAQIAYFSMEPSNECIEEHIKQGGLAAVYEHGYLSILKGDWTLRVEQAVNVPLTMSGRAPFMIANALAACLAAFAQGVPIEAIRRGLATFVASSAQTPGRMNLFNMGHYHALVDYAHNPHSYLALSQFVKNWTGGDRIGVVGAPGDRRNEDFVLLGELSAQMFDRIIVKEDDDRRGREAGEVADWILKGLTSQPTFSGSSTTILSETEAINTALDSATDGSLVVILPESVSRAIALIEARNPKAATAPPVAPAENWTETVASNGNGLRLSPESTGSSEPIPVGAMMQFGLISGVSPESERGI
jgi:cyanophycin synthetase